MHLFSRIQILFAICFILLANPLFAANPMVSDSVITSKIKAKITMDPTLSVFKINILTKNGIVLISGEVNSDTDASALVELAQATNGVKDVETRQLKIKNSDQPFTDAAITAKVKGTFIREKLFGKDVSPMIKVETNNGIVYLSGTVKSKHEIDNAIALAKSIHGVNDVESRLIVKKP